MNSRKYSILLIFLLTCVYLSAHPHVFIDIGIVIKDLKSAKISWTFDPMESQNKIYFFDDDGDGLLNSDEINTLYLEGFKSVKDFNYFINIVSDGIQYPVKEISNFNAKIEEDGRLTTSFTIDLPEMGDDEKLSITHFDTSYFVAFGEPVSNKISLNASLYSAIFKNKEKPFYYDPGAGREKIIDTSKPKKGWLKAYPTEVFISKNPLILSSNNYNMEFRERIVQIQKVIYFKLSTELNRRKEKKSLGLIAYILLLAFIYGSIHALGPGHRKIIISSYILSRKKISYFKSIGISMISALIHSGTGILSILILDLVFTKIKPIFMENITDYLEVLSYGGVLLLAIILIIMKLIPRTKKDEDKPIALSVIILSSLIPCPGAITIMLFSLSLNMLGIGIITVCAMSAGIGLTLSLISVITLKGKNAAYRINNNRLKIINSIFEWCGLILLLVFSIFMISSLIN